ncbi:MAG: alpha/beta fold hydrolase, partial [Holophagales bacterium]|nr:alpha/beta fold hydrolase [Holophagales bacterium]
MSRLESPESSQSRFTEVEGLRLHYLTAGPEDGPPVILLHGWPTSAFLWRRVMPAIAETRRVVALDLPGFGRSDKPLDASYSFRFYRRILDGFFDQIDEERVALAVHDLGGPIGLYWASQNPARLERLAILNTLVYPEVSWAVKAFVLSCRLPGVRSIVTSPWGLKQALHLGVTGRKRLRDDAIPGTQEPFRDAAARKALLKAGLGMNPKGLVTIARWIPTVEVPVGLVYGARDRILPDVRETMARLQVEIPHAELTELEDCGH